MFERLQREGVVPPGVRFQVSLPTPLAPLTVFVDQADRAVVEPACEERLLAELATLARAIPHERLAVQWDVAVEIGLLEGAWPAHFDDVERGVVDRLTRQVTAVDSAPNGWELSPGSKAPYATPLPPPKVPGYDATAPFATVADARATENGLADDYYVYLTTGGTGSLVAGAPDARIANVNALLPGPFLLTGPTMSDDDYAGSPVHRFYQMWQQLDCSAAYATRGNASGCQADPFAWVEQTSAAGSNRKPEPRGYAGEGSTAMEFYSMRAGDIRYTRELADEFTISDNYHQAVQGGTGANHVMMMTGDAIWYSDGRGHAAVPPANQIENPDPAPGTNNWYTQDGYSGGTYSACADASQPGVRAVRDYLAALDRPVDPNCEPGHYYLLNNYAPGYFGDGTVNTDTFVIPPSPLRTIGDELNEHDVSWAYFGDQFDAYLADKNLYDTLGNSYCDICNGFQYGAGIMTDAAAILVTADEGGGYYDAGYVQAVDFFGDGTRIPMIAVSKYARGGRVSHEYTDHVSILKFVERNWALPPVTERSRDNLPNPVQLGRHPYVPVNGPAIGDLFDMFDFDHRFLRLISVSRAGCRACVVLAGRPTWHYLPHPDLRTGASLKCPRRSPSTGSAASAAASCAPWLSEASRTSSSSPSTT